MPFTYTATHKRNGTKENRQDDIPPLPLIRVLLNITKIHHIVDDIQVPRSIVYDSNVEHNFSMNYGN